MKEREVDNMFHPGTHILKNIENNIGANCAQH